MSCGLNDEKQAEQSLTFLTPGLGARAWSHVQEMHGGGVFGLFSLIPAETFSSLISNIYITKQKDAYTAHLYLKLTAPVQWW